MWRSCCCWLPREASDAAGSSKQERQNEALRSVDAMPLCPKNTEKGFEAGERCVARWSHRREAGRLEMRSFKDPYLASRLSWEGLLLYQ